MSEMKISDTPNGQGINPLDISYEPPPEDNKSKTVTRVDVPKDK